MAITVRSTKYIKYVLGTGNEKTEVSVELYVDTSTELPAVEPMDGVLAGKKLHQGSMALIIKEGRLAVLAGDGKWYIDGEAVE